MRPLPAPLGAQRVSLRGAQHVARARAAAALAREVEVALVIVALGVRVAAAGALDPQLAFSKGQFCFFVGAVTVSNSWLLQLARLNTLSPKMRVYLSFLLALSLLLLSPLRVETAKLKACDGSAHMWRCFSFALLDR